MNRRPQPGRRWGAEKRRAGPSATATDARHHTRTEGMRRSFATYELGEDKLFGHIKLRETRTRFLELRGYPPPQRVRIAIIRGVSSPHLATRY